MLFLRLLFRELGYNFYPTGLLDGTVHGDTVEVKLPFSKFNAPGDVRATFFLYCISLFDYLQFMEGHTRWLSSCIVFPSFYYLQFMEGHIRWTISILRNPSSLTMQPHLRLFPTLVR